MQLGPRRAGGRSAECAGRQHPTWPVSRSRSSTVVRIQSVSPRNDGHFAGFEPEDAQDWRAFRARLVDMERTKAWHWEPSHNPDSPHLLWYQGTECRPSSMPSNQARRPPHPAKSQCTSSSSLQGHTHHKANISEASWGSKQVWAHSLVQPEVGCVLLARHDSEATQGFFHRAVILITAHDDVQGTVGLVLNKPTPITLHELTTVTQSTQGFRAVFGHQRLHLGGPVGLDRVTLLHRYRGLTGATSVAEGLYTGGLTDAMRLAQAGLAHPSHFTLVLGMSGWAPHQLQQELEAGYWHVVAAGPDLLLPKPSSRTASTDSDLPQGPGRPPAWLTAWSGARLPGVPPLRPPPAHPQKTVPEPCLWTRVVTAAQLL